jgi:uncharacterized membrane protein
MTAGVLAPAPAEPAVAPSSARPGRPVGRATVALLLVANVLVVTGTPAPLRAAVVLPVAVLLPGAWLMRVLGVRRPAGWDALLHAIAFGLCFLLAVSLAVAVLPVRGALSPLGCLAGFDVAMAALLAVAALRARQRAAGSPNDPAPDGTQPAAPAEKTTGTTGTTAATGTAGESAPPADTPAGTPAAAPAAWDWSRWTRLSAWGVHRPVRIPAAAAPVLLAAIAVVLAVGGAIRLNAGGSGILTALAFTAGAMALLGAALPGVGATSPAAERVRDHAAATTVFLLGLAVLLGTSLRGTGVTGHDIKIEMHVLQGTLTAGHWQLGGMAPDYAACLSITTLPAFLHHLLGLAPLDVFRICNQILFAGVGVGVFLLARRLLPAGAAVAAAGLFLAFPTFVNDMPMLNRQELALVFFTVAMLALLDDRGSRRQRLLTFGVMAAGLTVSHYSTTYVTVGLLLFGWLVRTAMPVLGALRRRLRVPAGLTRRLTGGPARVLGELPAWRGAQPAPRPLLGPAVILLLVAFSIGWSMVTGSGGGLVRTVQDTVAAVQRSNSATADAVGYGFFNRQPVRTDEQVLHEYLAAHGAPADPDSAYRLAATACPILLLPADILPETVAGRGLQAVGIPPGEVTAGSRLAAVALFQLGALLGVVLLWWAARRSRGPVRDLAALGVAALGLLGATVVLPQLSLNYGLLRLFQQFLILLAPLVVIALTTVLGGLGRRVPAIAAATVVTACFVSTSGLLPQLLGGYPPQLNLNNAGPYYRAWYAAAADVEVARWLDTSVRAGRVIAADSADTALLRATTRFDPREGVAPGIVPPGAYVQVEAANQWAQAVLVANDRILTITFPLRCVAAGRPLLYSRDGRLVYGPTT